LICGSCCNNFQVGRRTRPAPECLPVGADTSATGVDSVFRGGDDSGLAGPASGISESKSSNGPGVESYLLSVNNVIVRDQ
jgi:hypothetical protein